MSEKIIITALSYTIQFKTLIHSVVMIAVGMKRVVVLGVLLSTLLLGVQGNEEGPDEGDETGEGEICMHTMQ